MNEWKLYLLILCYIIVFYFILQMKMEVKYLNLKILNLSVNGQNYTVLINMIKI